MAKALTTLGPPPPPPPPPRIAVMCSSKFGEGWWKVEGVSGERNTIFSLSLRYGGNRKSGKNSNGMTLNQISAQ